MQYVIAIGLIVGVFFQRNSKLYTFIILSFICVLFGLNIHHMGNSSYLNEDFMNYHSLYTGTSEHLSNRDMELGFKYLIVLSNNLGLEFNTFRTMVAIVGYMLMCSTIFLLDKKNINFILLLYLIYPFLNDAIQIRNFLSMSIMIFAIRYLIKPSTLNVVKYILLIGIASTVHISSIFYFLFVFVKYIKVDFLFKLILSVTIPLVALSYSEIFPQLISVFIENSKVASYFDRRTTWGLALVFSILLMHFISFYFMYIQVHSSSVKSLTTSKEESLIEKINFQKLLLKINILLLLISPLLVFDLNFIRIYRNILPLNYIIFFQAIFLSRSNPKMFLNNIIITLLFVLFMFIVFYGLHSYTQIFPVMEDNILF